MFKEYIEYIARTFEAIGIITIVVGTILAFGRFFFRNLSYKLLRQELGKAILLGLEILVAGDIIATVATKPEMEDVLVLGLIVIIRTFLSISIEVEIEGKFPWQSMKPVDEDTNRKNRN